MTTSRLQRTVEHYRDALRRHEASAEHALTTAHAHTRKTIQARLDTVYRQIAAKQREGEDIPLSWLYERDRLQSLRSLITHQVSAYSVLAQMTIRHSQRDAVSLGQQAALSLLKATVPSGVTWSFGIPSPAALANLVGATQNGSPLADLFAGFGAEAARNVSTALITGITLGNNPRAIAAHVEQALDVPRWRALTISRTELLRSYRGANLATFRANSDVCEQWRWVAAKSSRTCIACVMMDGTLHDVDEEFESHVCCRCTPVPVTRSWSGILGPLGIDTSGLDDAATDDYPSGEDWFNAQDEDIQQTILGKAKFAAWKDGDFALSDTVGRSEDPDWGTSIRVKALKELV